MGGRGTWRKGLLIGSVVVLTGPCAINLISLPAAKGLNVGLTNNENKAAVFCSGVDYERTVFQLAVDLVGGFLRCDPKVTDNVLPECLSKSKSLALSRRNVSALTTFLMYTPLVLRQTLEGNRVEWYRNATKAEITSVAMKPEYGTIIFVGHGTYSSFQAEDGILSAKVVKEAGIPPKEAVIQHTCSYRKGREEGLKEALKASQGYAVGDGIVAETQNYSEAWKRVFTGY